MRHINLDNKKYLGLDIVKNVIEKLKKYEKIILNLNVIF